MVGGLINTADLVLFGVAGAASLWLACSPNRLPAGTPEHQSLRVCRIGLALSFWGLAGFGGFIFAITSFVLGVVGVVKGRNAYGVIVMVLAIAFWALGWVPLISKVAEGIK